MKPSLLDFLACPSCGGALSLHDGRLEGGEVMDGDLTCAGCGTRFPVQRGVPRFVGGDKNRADRTAAAFGWEWQAFPDIDAHHEQQFLDWIAPVAPGAFAGRVVLEGGCGKGRHTRQVARYGARAVIGIDLSDAVDVAFENTRGEQNAHVVQADLCRLPIRRRSCDHVFSVGVLHHLRDPLEGFRALAGTVQGGGALSVWVYGAENNAWISTVISPIREAITSHLPPRALYVLSWVLSVPLWAALGLLYRPVAGGRFAWMRPFLFYYPYLAYISRFPFREIHHIVHDHLAAPVAHYLRRDEVESWYRSVGAESVAIDWHNNNSWRGYGTLPAGLRVEAEEGMKK